MYRWHIADPINFEKDLRVDLQALGWKNRKYKKMSDDISSVAYWYQAEPHAPFPKLPSVKERMRTAKPKKSAIGAPAKLNQGEIVDP